MHHIGNTRIAANLSRSSFSKTTSTYCSHQRTCRNLLDRLQSQRSSSLRGLLCPRDDESLFSLYAQNRCQSCLLSVVSGLRMSAMKCPQEACSPSDHRKLLPMISYRLVQSLKLLMEEVLPCQQNAVTLSHSSHLPIGIYIVDIPLTQ